MALRTSAQEQRCLTLGDINYCLEHQRHQNDKHHIVDKELRCMPVWRRSAAGNGIRAGIFARSRSRVGSSLEGSGGRCGESRVQGIEGVDSWEPGEKRSHFSTSIAHATHPSGRLWPEQNGLRGGKICRSEFQNPGAESQNAQSPLYGLGLSDLAARCYYDWLACVLCLLYTWNCNRTFALQSS